MPSIRRFPRIAGFTLIELLVVIAICGVLMALLFPAVQAARESARRITCFSRFRQIGLAIANYECACKQFPPSKTQSTDRRTREHNIVTFLLPYMEQQQVYDAFDFRYHWFQYPNNEAAKVRLPELLCPFAPTDRFCEGDEYYPSDYAACEQFFVRNDLIAAGIITRRSNWWSVLKPSFEGVSTTASVTDGLSNSMLFFECAGRPFKFERGRVRDVDSFGVREGTDWADVKANFWIHRGCGPEGRQLINCSNNNELYAFHPGGAPFLFGDNTVRFLSETVDPELFTSLFTCCAGDTVEVVW